MRRRYPIRPLEGSRRAIIRGLIRPRPIVPVGSLRFMGKALTVGGRFITKAK